MSAKLKKVKANPVVIHGCGGASWAIPRTAETYDQMVQQMIKAIFLADDEPHWNRANLHPYYEKHAIFALRAIGITRPKETK